MFTRIGVLALALALSACKPGGGDPPPDAHTDSGTPDSGTPDSGTPDSGTPDSGMVVDCNQPLGTSDKGAEWGFLLGTPKSEEFLDVAVNGNGMLYLAGYVNGEVGQARFDPSGDSRGVLVRVSSGSSNALYQSWTKYFDTPGTDTVEALAFHPTTGDLYFAGRTTGAFNRTNGAAADFVNQGQQDVFVGGTKGSARDVILYQGGTERPQHPNRLVVDDQGHLIVSGFDDIYVPNGTNYVDRWEDPFVTHLQRSGPDDVLTARWTWSANTVYADTLAGLAINPRNKNIYVTGNNGGGGRSERGAVVRKLNFDDGSTSSSDLWQQSAISMDTIQAAQFLADGNLLIAGTTFGVMGEKSYGEQDVVLRVLNMDSTRGPVGAPLWTKQYGSSGSEFLTDMAVDAKGNIVVVGETLASVIDGDPSAYKGSYDVFMMKFNAQGERLDVRQWGSAADDHPNAVAVDASGSIFVTGYTAGELINKCPAQGERDAFLIIVVPPGSAPSNPSK